MKKKIQKLFMCKLCLCAFLLLIFSACSTKTKDVSEYSVINLRDVIDKEAKVNLADEIADVKYVPLQVTSDDESLIYSPRTLDIIYNDYVVLSPSKKVYYTNDKITPISKKKIETIIEQFQHYKYYNDMLMNKNYFK